MSVGRTPSYIRTLRNRPFLRLWSSQLISQSGDFVFEVALLWLVLEITGSVFAVGLVVAATLLPGILLVPFLGVYVDRWDRRRILLLTNLVEGVVVAVLAVLVWSGSDGLDLLVVVAFLLGTGSQWIRVASGAMVPAVVRVEDLPPANSLLSFSNSFNQIIGLSVGGLAVALFGVTLPIEYDALSFFLAALILVGLPLSTAPPEPAGPTAGVRLLGEFSEGLRYLRANRFLLELIVLGGAVNFFGNGVAAVFAPYAKLVLHGGAAVYGFLGASLGLGSIVGAALIGRADTRRTAGRYLLAGGMAGGVVIALFGVTGALPLALAEAAALGALLAIINIPVAILVQAKVPGRLLGRVSATLGGLVGALGPLGALVAGALAASTSVPTVFVVSGGAIVVLFAAGTVGMRELRQVRY